MSSDYQHVRPHSVISQAAAINCVIINPLTSRSDENVIYSKSNTNIYPANKLQENIKLINYGVILRFYTKFS